MRFRTRFVAQATAVVVAAFSLPAVSEEDGADAAAPATSATEDQAEQAVIATGSKVSIEYTLTLDSGEVADTNVGGDPLVYEQGAGQILPALETALAGLAVGDSKQVDLSAEQGYGPVRDDLYHTVAANEIPEDARSVGAMLIAQAPNGQQVPVRVHEVNEDEIVIDRNHPLAGKNLHFAVKIVAIE